MVIRMRLNVKLYVYCMSCWGLSLSIPLMRIKRLKPYVCCNNPELCKLSAGFLCVFCVIVTYTYTYCSSKKNNLFVFIIDTDCVRRERSGFLYVIYINVGV
jgi:hypothetical protein